jgi:hypothetical protein
VFYSDVFGECWDDAVALPKVGFAHSIFGSKTINSLMKSATGHDPEPVPSTSHPHNLSP